MKTLLQQGL
jgi:hypothetical protein